jgi:hypothetical protein
MWYEGLCGPIMVMMAIAVTGSLIVVCVEDRSLKHLPFFFFSCEKMHTHTHTCTHSHSHSYSRTQTRYEDRANAEIGHYNDEGIAVTADPTVRNPSRIPSTNLHDDDGRTFIAYPPIIPPLVPPAHWSAFTQASVYEFLSGECKHAVPLESNPLYCSCDEGNYVAQTVFLEKYKLPVKRGLCFPNLSSR